MDKVQLKLVNSKLLGPEEILRVIRSSSETSALYDGFLALKSNCQHFGYLVHTSYDVDTDSVPFSEGLSMNYTTNMKHYLFIAIIIVETQQNFFLI